MIAFSTWLPEIIEFCYFIKDDFHIKKAWINKDYSDTSVTDFDELYEQIFDDLDAEYFLKDLQHYLPNEKFKSSAIELFILSIKDVDAAREKELSLKDNEALFNSSQWQNLRKSADNVIANFENLEKYPPSNI